VLEHPSIACPYCWEQFTIELDLSVPEQTYIEDCQVCCQPMVISYTSFDGELQGINVEQDNA